MSNEDQLKAALQDVCMMGLTAIAKPRDGNARAALRRACLHGTAVLKAQAAEAEIDALAPADPRPAPPLPEAAPAIPAPAATAYKPRLPYKEEE